MLEEQERRVFTERIRYFLQNLSKDNINSNWDTWLKLYWQNRIKDIPKKLTDSEMQSMLNWLPHLGEKFTDGVEIAIKMRQFKLNISGSFLHLDDLPKKYPEATAKLLIYLLECSPPHFFLHNLDDILGELGASEISDEIAYALNQSLIRNGKGEIPNKNT
ncbi:MAG: hypothetical protein QG556_638 [Pseudomonadota bacterium]|nr:hypothetical protein [Pseudomonadota bacterium]